MHLTGEEGEASCGKATPTLHSQQASELSLQHRLLACKALLLSPGLEQQGREAARVPGLGALAAEWRLGPRVACLWGGCWTESQCAGG